MIYFYKSDKNSYLFGKGSRSGKNILYKLIFIEKTSFSSINGKILFTTHEITTKTL